MADLKNFSTVESTWEMFSPVDLAASQGVSLGGPLEKIGDNSNPFKQLLNILENNGRGVYSISGIEAKIKEIKSKSEFGNVDLSKYVSIWTNEKIVDVGDGTQKEEKAQDHDGSTKAVKSLQEVIGTKFTIPPGSVVSLITSKSPFFNPAVRNGKKSEIFLNGMPNTVLSQLVPFLQAEFQFTRDPSNFLQTAGQLKFLMGAADTTKFTGANKALAEAHVRESKDDKGNIIELDSAGMEMFTSPQTLVNPQPNKDVGTRGNRFTDVIDPFRPFATLEHVTISVSPAGAGFFTYKKANMTIKVHDRSRLAEISDLLRPRVYTGVTIWMTYGWLAPVRGTQNPYFKYVNDNLLMREAYHVVNSSFSFDHVGQVTINLELFTKGVPELRDMKISSNKGDPGFNNDTIKRLIENISKYRQALRLDSPEGFNKEIRVFQILDAAETGAFPPNLKASEVTQKIDSLEKTLVNAGNTNPEALSGLITSMRALYKNDGKKFILKEEYESRVAKTVSEMFEEVRTGPDPFLPIEGKDADKELIKVIAGMNSAPATKVKKSLKNAVSFGKLFSVFALRAVLSIPETIHETQVFFYSLNESCGPISSHSIAEFPIDMHAFVDQYTEHVKSKGGEKITLEDFLRLCINAQFLDNRAPGYGFRQFYKSYEPGKDAEFTNVKNAEQDFENQLAFYSRKYGPFKKPVVEMHIECSHERITDAGENDILQQLAYSASSSSTVDIKDANGKAARRIMRIHVYDKQTNAYKEASRLLKSETSSGHDGYFNGPSTEFAEEKTGQQSGFISTALALYATVQTAIDGKLSITDYTNAQQAKYLIGQMMPTIRYGSNGSTITQANLSSKADPLLSTVQMIRTQTVRNTASPNGSGAAGIPLRVIPAQLQMNSLGNPLASAAQKYFIDFQTGTTLDNLYILTNYTHNFSPGKFETNWTFGFADGYGVFEGAQSTAKIFSELDPNVPKGKT